MDFWLTILSPCFPDSLHLSNHAKTRHVTGFIGTVKGGNQQVSGTKAKLN